MHKSIKTQIYIILLLSISFTEAQNEIYIFEHVNVIPMDYDTILYDYRVIISGNKIITLEPGSNKVMIQSNNIINGKGKFLIPGLVESHYHLQNNIENEFKLLIANGVSTVRNMAEYKGQDHIEIREKANKNKVLSPNYYTAGPYLKSGDLKTKTDVDMVLKNHLEKSYDFLKIADNLPKKIYNYLILEAKKYNIAIVGHGQRELPLAYSLKMKSIEHLEEFMNIFTEEEKEDLNFLNKAAAEIKASGLYVAPTLGIFEMISNYADDDKFAELKKNHTIKYLPSHYSDYWKSESNPFRTKPWFTAVESLVRLDKELQWQKKFTKILHDHKVPLFAGSDTYGFFIPGFSIHHELELINSAGISPFESLKTATVNPAKYLNRISIAGTISVGKSADLVLLNKNPLKDIKNTKSINGVMIKGLWLNRKNLDKILKEVINSHKN